MDISLKTKLVEEAVDNAYNKSGEKAVDSIKLSSQTVINSIRELEKIPNYCPDKNKKIEKKKVENYIEDNYDTDNIKKIYISGDGKSIFF